MCKKSVREGEWIWMFKAKQTSYIATVQKTEHHVWSHRIYFYNASGSADEMAEKYKIVMTFFSFSVRLCTKSSEPNLLSASVFRSNGNRIQFKLASLMRHQGEWHVPALKSDFFFLCDVCDFMKLAYFTQCLQRCMLW